MPTLRFTARFYGDTVEITRPYRCESLSARELGLFLEARKHDFGDKLRWVSIERSEETALYYDVVEWDEVERRYP